MISEFRTQFLQLGPDPVRGWCAQSGAAIKGDWPIVAVTQEPGRAVEVALIDGRPSEMSGQKAFLRNIGGRWTIERFGGWVAD